MSTSIPTASYGRPSGGIATRKETTQLITPYGLNGIVYLPGGSAASPISPAFSSFWEDTTNGQRYKGYWAYTIGQKLNQGGAESTGGISMETSNHGIGGNVRNYCFAQHTIQIPEFFVVSASPTLQGAFSLQSGRSVTWRSLSGYRGCVGLSILNPWYTFEFVDGDPEAPDPSGPDRPAGQDNPLISLRCTTRLVNSGGTTLSSFANVGGTAFFPPSTLKGRSIRTADFSASLSTSSGKPHYLVCETGIRIDVDALEFTYPFDEPNATWRLQYFYVDVVLSFDDESSSLMQDADTNMALSTSLGVFDLTSGNASDGNTKPLASR